MLKAKTQNKPLYLDPLIGHVLAQLTERTRNKPYRFDVVALQFLSSLSRALAQESDAQNAPVRGLSKG